VPPETTGGVEPLMEGVVAAPELPVLPVDPVFDDPELAELEDEEDPDDPELVTPVEPPDPEPAPVPFAVLLEPGCSWATTMPIRAAAPVAPSTSARVARRSQARARSRLCGVFGWMGRGMSDSDLVARIALHPSIPTSTLSQGWLWACCDIVPGWTPRKTAPPATITALASGDGGQGGLMSQVNTVRGPVQGAALGSTLMHEHIFVLSPDIEKTAAEWDEAAEQARAVQKLRELKQHGIDTMVDLTVVGLGRYIPRIATIAEQVPEINVVVATGVYTYNEVPMFFHFRGPGTVLGGSEPMIDLFVREIRDGIGETGVRPGILKCATDRPGLTPGVERVLRAVARAHRETGVPITTHTPTPPEPWGLEQQRVFREEGVDLGRVVIGHSGGTVNTAYHLELIDNGSYLGFDHFGIPGITLEERVDAVARLCARGFAERIVLSHDAMCFVDWFPRALIDRSQSWRWTYISDEVLPVMRSRGITDTQITTMLVDNPRRILEGGAPY
jgi:phosphotriesterase-related protein